MRRKNNSFSIVIVFTFFALMVLPLRADKKYDTDFIITHYDIILQPDFNDNAEVICLPARSIIVHYMIGKMSKKMSGFLFQHCLMHLLIKVHRPL